MSDPSAVVPESASSAERRSCLVFSTLLLLVLLAVSFPELPPQMLQGILWSGVGVLMLLMPPAVRLPRAWSGLAAGFVACSLLGFLPRAWIGMSPWRLDLEMLGLDTGPYGFVQPQLAAEAMAGFAVTALVAVFLLGHRVGSRWHHRLALGLVLGVALWTAAALYWHRPAAVFGFFPNRNHSATLLAMAAFVGLGSFAQAIHLKSPWMIALSLVPTCLFAWVLFTVSESRAGVVLVAAGFLAWIGLTGLRNLRGHAGKAVALLLLGLGGTFLIVDSKVKSRLDATVEQIEAPSAAAGAPKIGFDEGGVAQPDPPMDGRIAIFRDTWDMVRGEPWCGVGPGQFGRVFPQYRRLTTASNDARCVHPESDWLAMLAEVGWPATLCLLAGVAVVMFTALRRAWGGRARLLRMGCLVAALLLCLHGVFDVPGHRVGLAWAAALLVAMSLRPPAENGLALAAEPSRTSRLAWRCLGLATLLAGACLLHAQWTDAPLLPSVHALRQMQQVKALYDADRAAYESATAAAREYQPPADEDLLEAALVRVNAAIRIAPLDPHLHYIRGALALHFDDKPDIAAEAFAIQRRLVPNRVSYPLDQALAWVKQDPQQTVALWAEALRRAAAEQARFPQSPSGTANTYQKVLRACGNDATLAAAALQLAGQNPDLLARWARAAPVALLDREMPRLLAAPAASDDRNALFRVWLQRGTKGLAASFAQAHPELALPPR